MTVLILILFDDIDDADDDLHLLLQFNSDLSFFLILAPKAWVGFLAVSVACITSGPCLGPAFLVLLRFSTALCPESKVSRLSCLSGDRIGGSLHRESL